MKVRVARKDIEALDICTVEFKSIDGRPLPAFSAGSHIDVHLPNGLIRQYSLCNAPGKLAVNTDGGGLCNNHPANRGGIAKVIEVVRQLRGEALPAVQVKDCKLALVQHQPPRRSFKPYVRRWTGPVAFAHEAHSPQNT